MFSAVPFDVSMMMVMMVPRWSAVSFLAPFPFHTCKKTLDTSSITVGTQQQCLPTATYTHWLPQSRLQYRSRPSNKWSRVTTFPQSCPEVEACDYAFLTAAKPHEEQPFASAIAGGDGSIFRRKPVESHLNSEGSVYKETPCLSSTTATNNVLYFPLDHTRCLRSWICENDRVPECLFTSCGCPSSQELKTKYCSLQHHSVVLNRGGVTTICYHHLVASQACSLMSILFLLLSLGIQAVWAAAAYLFFCICLSQKLVSFVQVSRYDSHLGAPHYFPVVHASFQAVVHPRRTQLSHFVFDADDSDVFVVSVSFSLLCIRVSVVFVYHTKTLLLLRGTVRDKSPSDDKYITKCISLAVLCFFLVSEDVCIYRVFVSDPSLLLFTPSSMLFRYGDAMVFLRSSSPCRGVLFSYATPCPFVAFVSALHSFLKLLYAFLAFTLEESRTLVTFLSPSVLSSVLHILLAPPLLSFAVGVLQCTNTLSTWIRGIALYTPVQVRAILVVHTAGARQAEIVGAVTPLKTLTPSAAATCRLHCCSCWVLLARLAATSAGSLIHVSCESVNAAELSASLLFSCVTKEAWYEGFAPCPWVLSPTFSSRALAVSEARDFVMPRNSVLYWFSSESSHMCQLCSTWNFLVAAWHLLRSQSLLPVLNLFFILYRFLVLSSTLHSVLFLRRSLVFCRPSRRCSARESTQWSPRPRCSNNFFSVFFLRVQLLLLLLLLSWTVGSIQFTVTSDVDQNVYLDLTDGLSQLQDSLVIRMAAGRRLTILNFDRQTSEIMPTTFRAEAYQILYGNLNGETDYRNPLACDRRLPRLRYSAFFIFASPLADFWEVHRAGAAPREQPGQPVPAPPSNSDMYRFSWPRGYQAVSLGTGLCIQVVEKKFNTTYTLNVMFLAPAISSAARNVSVSTLSVLIWSAFSLILAVALV